MSIFNRFFDDRLNRVSKNQFFLQFSEIQFRLIAHKRFGKNFNFEQLSFDAFFVEIMRIFGSIEP